MPLALDVIYESVLVRIYHQASCETIQDDRRTIQQRICYPLYTNHKRHLKGPGQDGGVAGAAAYLGDHANYAAAVHLEDIGRCDVVGNDNGLTTVWGNRRVAGTGHVVEYFLDYSLNVTDALTQVGIVNAGK